MAATQLLRFILSSAIAPMLIFAVVWLVARVTKADRLRIPWAALSIAIVTIVVAFATAYLFLPVLFEDAETDIASVSALIMRDLPMYPAIDAAQRYILLYGPLTYIAHIPFYLVFGKSLVGFKSLGIISLLVSLIGLYRTGRSYASRAASLIGVGCAALVLFRYIGVEFWGRIDPAILACTVVSVWATLQAPRPAAIFINAAAFAAIPNLKISGIAYVLPLFVLLIIRRGWLNGVIAAFISAVLFPLPFLLPYVSLTNYIAVLKVASGHGLVLNFLIRNIQYSILLLLPVLVTFAKRAPFSRPQIAYLAAIVTGLCITCILGSKSGAGSYHLIPFIAPILHLYFWRRADLPPQSADVAFSKFAISWVLTTLFLSSTHLGTVLQTYREASTAKKIVNEIKRDVVAFPHNTIEVGVGDSFEDPRTRYGYLTTLAGRPYTISGAAVRDLQAGNIPIPPATVQYLSSCATEVWLIPKGQKPFSAFNTYFDTPHEAFEAPFQQAFLSHYKVIASGEFFDVWSCANLTFPKVIL